MKWCGVVAAALVALIFTFSGVASTSPAPLHFYASQSGRQTLDQGEGGGNPFASALIEAMSQPNLTLGELPSELTRLTVSKSRGHQSPDVPSNAEPANWQFQPNLSFETREPLIVVFSDYSASGGAPSLPGAQHDASRVGTAFANVGFQTETFVDPSLTELDDILLKFSERSAVADFAIVYTTGHGVEVDGVVFLLPGDYPISEQNRSLGEKAIR